MEGLGLTETDLEALDMLVRRGEAPNRKEMLRMIVRRGLADGRVPTGGQATRSPDLVVGAPAIRS